ncbi:restriction endonuclease [Methanococcoides sp. AM1]|uniref:restriction endonuclease n=1 Tax=Methanococcoides sp. AM1 TaxID=1201011 RepID=UPI0010830192|nr:restriction endonuclease [Methanococcoides sp. AM1]
MSFWLVRAGSHGEQEQVALEENVVTIGWNEFPDLSSVKSRDELYQIYREEYPDASKNKAGNEVGQIWRFVREMQIGDLVALPLKTESSIAIGKIDGNYTYKELSDNVRHIRPVKWLKTLPRSAFDQDILYSLGAFMTVCKIQRNDAKNRVMKLLKGEVQPKGTSNEVPQIETENDQEETIDIEDYSRDQIVKYIESKFKGHGLARLVDEILKAQGYITRVSPPGRDGGIDILAASGPLGFENPRICVQVKSSYSPVDVKILRELQGVMSTVGADQALLVSWGGFNSAAKQEAKNAFFTTRLWDQGNILAEIFKYYERFDDELKAELPLKRIWSLVIEE